MMSSHGCAAPGTLWSAIIQFAHQQLTVEDRGQASHRFPPGADGTRQPLSAASFTATAELPKECCAPIPNRSHNDRLGPTPKSGELSARPAPQSRNVIPLQRVLRCVLLRFVNPRRLKLAIVAWVLQTSSALGHRVCKLVRSCLDTTEDGSSFAAAGTPKIARETPSSMADSARSTPRDIHSECFAVLCSVRTTSV